VRQSGERLIVAFCDYGGATTAGEWLIVAFYDFGGAAAFRRPAHCCVLRLWRGCGSPTGGSLLRFVTLEGLRQHGEWLIVAFYDFGGVAAVRRAAHCCVL